MPPAFWNQSHGLATLLWPLSVLYRWAWYVRKTCYRWGWIKTHTVACPVVVVGNVVAGGVGKTPVVIELVRRLQRDGYRVGVVSKGYGRRNKLCKAVTAHSSADAVGDEPLLIHLATKAPVVVANNRVQAIETLLAEHPQTQLVISDDGLQHLALHRDVEVVVFDERFVGNGRLLPAGMLREPWPRQPMAPASFVLQDIPRQIAGYAIDGYGKRHNFAALRHKSLRALAGIAKPQAFFDMLKARDLPIMSSQSYADHADLNQVILPVDDEDVLLCTEKDAVKLWPRDRRILAVPLKLDINVHFLKAFDATIAQLLPSAHSASTPYFLQHTT